MTVNEKQEGAAATTPLATTNGVGDTTQSLLQSLEGARAGLPFLSLSNAAILWARLGQPVFPLKANEKKPLTSHGFKDATTDEAVIAEWWDKVPNANLGLPTGFLFDVLDVDTKGANGWETVSRLNNLGMLTGVFGQVLTPTGGGHLLFPVSGGGNHTHAKTGIDYRGKGGYVVGAPSAIEGKRYEFQSTRYGSGKPFNWDEFLSVVNPKQKAKFTGPTTGDLSGVIKSVRAAKEGERNHHLFWAAKRFVENGEDPKQLLEAALSIGLSEEEALLTINSAAKEVK